MIALIAYSLVILKYEPCSDGLHGAEAEFGVPELRFELVFRDRRLDAVSALPAVPVRWVRLGREPVQLLAHQFPLAPGELEHEIRAQRPERVAGGAVAIAVDHDA